MAEGDSYRLSGMLVREFRGKKFISTSKESSSIEKLDDIWDVEAVCLSQPMSDPCKSWLFEWWIGKCSAKCTVLPQMC